MRSSTITTIKNFYRPKIEKLYSEDFNWFVPIFGTILEDDTDFRNNAESRFSCL